MKNIWKIFLIVPLLASTGLFFAGCAEENPDLDGYPKTGLRIDIVDLEQPVTVLPLKGVYNSDGRLVLDGSLSHDYLIRLSRPSPYDMMLTLEPINVNFPEKNVILSETKHVLPAGYVEFPVSVTFTDENLTFADADKEAETYEIGVRIAGVLGYKTLGKGVEAKVVVDKEAYRIFLSLAETEGRKATFVRDFNRAQNLSETPISYSFKAYLDKPASKDVKVTFTLEGLDPAFSGDWSVNPSSVVIPAGSRVSDKLTWTLSDNFLNGFEKTTTVDLKLNAAFESEDTYVALAKDDAFAISFEVVKNMIQVETLPLASVDQSWKTYDRSGWTAKSSGNVSTYYTNLGTKVLFDGVLNTSMDKGGGPAGFSLIVDMKETKQITGISSRYYNDRPFGPTELIISLSDDGITYRSYGKISRIPALGGHLFRFLDGPQSARYVKYEVLEANACYIAELNVYGPSQP